MLSASGHTIQWLKPDIGEEEWEFFNHPDKQDFYRRHGIDWERLLSAFGRGSLEPFPRSGRIGEIAVSGAYHRYDDYAKYLAKAKRGYRKSYNGMEESLQRAGSLTLKAPIILCCRKEALLFSGYRRLCLAWNYGMVPYAWLVPLS